jgi:hypothetical protein
MVWICLLLFIIGAFTNRIRGGLFGDSIRKFLPFYGTTLGRVVFSLPYVCVGALADPWLALSGLAMFISVIHGWGTFMDLGRNPDGWKDAHEGLLTEIFGYEKPEWTYRQRFWHNFSGLCFRGLMLTFLTSILLLFFCGIPEFLIFFASGILFGPLYWFSYKIEDEFGPIDGTPEYLWGGFYLTLFGYLSLFYR